MIGKPVVASALMKAIFSFALLTFFSLIIGAGLTAYFWLPELLELKKKIEAVSGADYNSVLLNFYRDGKDSVWWHADDEKELGENPNIASISLGATRQFGVAEYQNDLGEELYFDLNHGSLFIMSGTTQKYWRHSIPKMPKVKEGRINLTFRKFFA